MERNTSFEEKREFTRINTPNVTAAYRLLDIAKVANDNAKSESRVNNISLGGLSITTDSPIPENTPISVDLKLEELAGMVKSFGKVVWTRKNRPNVYEVGVVFSWWTKEEDKRDIADYIERNLL